MPGSQIVPSLLAALYGAIIGSSTDETSLGVLYPTSIRAGFAGEDDNFSDSDGSWAWHVVPAVNLFLALVVLLFLIEDRCSAEIIGWFDDLTGGRFSPNAMSSMDDKSAGHAGGSGMGRVERLALTSAMYGIMACMLFFSNDVFDDFASTADLADTAVHTAGPLLDIAARFSSFSILVVFLGLALALVHLAPSPQPIVPPLLFVLGPILLCSTVFSRFSLALHTALAWDTLTPAHIALLVIEPAGLLAVAGWILFGDTGSSTLPLYDSAAEKGPLDAYGDDKRQPPVLIVITQHD